VTSPLVSIVVPALNEQDNLEPLYGAIRAVFEQSCPDADFELIVVNDGSTDDTAAVLEELATRDPRVRALHFARNFGQQPALIAGLEAAEGNVVITMDADLEQPPAVVARMIELWKSGFQVVHGVRRDHPQTPFFKRWTSRMFYRVFSFLSRIPMEPGMLDFRLMDRQVVDAVCALPEADFFLRGIANWVGFRQTRLPYDSDRRTRGRSRYSLSRMVSFALRGLTSFSVFPLRLATYLGALMTMFTLIYGIHVAVAWFFWEDPTPGYASIVLLISLLFGVQFLLIGLLGEYVARIHVEVKRRPRYIVAARTDRRPPSATP